MKKHLHGWALIEWPVQIKMNDSGKGKHDLMYKTTWGADLDSLSSLRDEMHIISCWYESSHFTVLCNDSEEIKYYCSKKGLTFSLMVSSSRCKPHHMLLKAFISMALHQWFHSAPWLVTVTRQTLPRVIITLWFLWTFSICYEENKIWPAQTSRRIWNTDEHMRERTGSHKWRHSYGITGKRVKE